MKQKLSLIALAFIAVCTFAARGLWKVEAQDGQEKILFENGATIVDEQEFTTENMTLKLGLDIKKATGWDVKVTNSSEFLAPFTQIVQVPNADTGDLEDKERIVYIVGGNNPKDDLANKGGGFNGGGEQGKLPQSGTYYVVTPKKDGAMSVGIILNGDKEFFIVDATNAVLTPVLDGDGNETGTYTNNVVNADAVFTHDMFKVYNIDGVEQPYQDAEGENCIYDGGKGGIKVFNKLTGTVEFDVQANHTYYVFCTGSKLSCFGFVFTPAAAAEPEDIVISPASGDITAALDEASAGKLVRDITINLTEGANYTITNSIVAGGNVTINGNGANIDAAALTAPMITLANAELEAWTEANVSITGVNVKGLAKALFYSPGKNYYGDFTLENSVVEMAGDAITFDWTKGSVVKKFTVTNSTIYAPTATTKFLYSSQNGQKVTEYDAAQLQTFLLKNSTFYNLNPTKNFFNHRQTNQTFFVYDLEDNIFVNCGKSGQVVKGVNGGQSGKNPTWIVKGNVFNFEDADTSANESTGDDAEPVQDSVAGVVKFFNPANGNFNGKFYAETAPGAVGDPRWTLTTEAAPTDITISPADGDIYAALAAAEEGIAKVGNITINLTEGASYTISNTIAIPANLTINGNGADIDASALEANMIEQPNTGEVEGAAWDTTVPVKVVVKGVKVKGLKKTMLYSPKFNILTFTLDNSVVEVAADITVFDFTKGGFVTDFTITNSTLYAPTATSKALWSSQSGTKASEISAEQKQNITIKNSTLYNLAKSKNFFSHRTKGQKYLVFDIEGNIFVNCGKSGQVVRGLNEGQGSANPTWTVKGNVFNFDGADTSAAESTGDEAEPVQDSIEGVVEFTDAEGGDFNGSFGYTGETAPASIGGDPRWTFTFDKVYKVNVVAENGQVILEKTTYKEGEKVYADVKGNDGYEVVSVKIVNDATGEEIQPVEEVVDGQERHYFVMPASSVTITAVFAKLYDVTVAATENGSITVISVNMESEPYAMAGKKICLMVKPGDDYEVTAVTVKTADDQDVAVTAETGTEHGQEYNYYFIMPESAVTISASFQIIDGINTVTAVEQDGKWYNLQGVEVQKPVKGVFIHNGKKVILK